MEYNFNSIEKKWQEIWNQTNAYKIENDFSKPKCYVLDMFPYPSGAGLHVGHPLGYIASDIYCRYKRLKGFNVLHPMGYDAFGLPAEQYAIEHGIHPSVSTENNIKNFRSQLNNIGFCYDWERQVNTSEPKYYKWTQWIFLQLFNSFYNIKTNKAEDIKILENEFSINGSNVNIANCTTEFTANDWENYTEEKKREILMNYRLVFSNYGEVNWCEALGTVLANDEVVNGVSERGGHLVEKKRLRQWYLRITDYADRLLEGLQKVQFSDAMKDMQSNWIGRSYGANIKFSIENNEDEILEVYTTRPDTIFGVDFMVIAPEHHLIEKITTAEQKENVEKYITYVKSRSERERMAEKKITGCFTGSFALNPFNQTPIPIWISEYVLAGYGTGAIMAVPCGDERDYKFAKYFNIPITNIIGKYFDGENANPTKEATLENSDFLNGLVMKDAIEIAITKLEENGIGKRKINYKMRDAAFSRQRYWGEPFPIVWENDTAYDLAQDILPLELPFIDELKPGENAQGPLSNNKEWMIPVNGKIRETSTMPGFAGSSWYFLRYMDPNNNETFCDKKISDYWNQVDVYVGGTEHAVGHLLYSRMWTKFLYDKGFISFDEPFKKLLNQGMIQGSSRFVYRINGSNTFVSKSLLKDEEFYNDKKIDKIHVDINIVDGTELNIEDFKKWRNNEYANAEFILNEYGKYICGTEVEKMSKSKFNTVNPDDLVIKYGADTFRMYEMFLGPIEMSKPWDTKGIEGVHRFIKKLWRLFYEEINTNGEIKTKQVWNNEIANEAELKIIHKTIKKIEEDTERFSYNTTVSAFMICVNELADLKCTKKEILEPLLILLNPYAPHITSELYNLLGNENSILYASFPKFESKYLIESTKEYPISINGKMRTTLNFPIDVVQKDIEETVLQNEIILKWLDGKEPKKIIFVKNKMVNIVI